MQTTAEDKKTRESLAAYNEGFHQAMRDEQRNSSAYTTVHERQMYSLGFSDGRNLYELQRLRSES